MSDHGPRASSEADDITFADLGLAEPLVQAVTALGYEEPTPIQREAIPTLLQGRDLLGLAATGTGKTAAFALPMLHLLGAGDDGPGPRGLVLVPTRELAMQVAEAIQKYGRALRIRVLAVYGGASMHLQIRALQRGVDVVVATPGRALDHLRRATLSLDHIKVCVLDEADEMLDMGFQDDLEAILDAMPEVRQTALFSATFPKRLQTIATRTLRDPAKVEIAREEIAEGDVPRVRQVAYVVSAPHKRAALARVLDMESPQSALVFCRTRVDVDELSELLNSRGYRAEALHGGLSQPQRDRVMQRLRSGVADLVVATDVAARGLDVEHLTHVFNFDVPSAPEQYVHRIGRTGRAGREGVAITLAEPRERGLLRNIERVIRTRLPVEGLPTLADLKARRLDLVRGQVREAVIEGDLDAFRRVVDVLAEELDIVDIAAAAIKALHQATGEDHEELPRTADRSGAWGPPKEREPRDTGRADGDWVRLYVSVGRLGGMRPGDLFGAVVNESGIHRDGIGAIRITDQFSLIDIDREHVDTVIRAMRGLTWKGRKIVVKPDRQKG